LTTNCEPSQENNRAEDIQSLKRFWTTCGRNPASAANRPISGTSFPFWRRANPKEAKVTVGTNETHSPSRHIDQRLQPTRPALGFFRLLIRTVVPVCLELTEAPPIQTTKRGTTRTRQSDRQISSAVASQIAKRKGPFNFCLRIFFFFFFLSRPSETQVAAITRGHLGFPKDSSSAPSLPALQRISICKRLPEPARPPFPPARFPLDPFSQPSPPSQQN